MEGTCVPNLETGGYFYHPQGSYRSRDDTNLCGEALDDFGNDPNGFM